MKVFVYGTLKRGGKLFHNIEDYVKSTKETTASGKLYHLSWFPAAVFEGNDTIVGEVHTFNEDDAKKVLNILDTIEGEGTLYSRVNILTADGPAYAYEYINKEQLSEERRVEGGNWQ